MTFAMRGRQPVLNKLTREHFQHVMPPAKPLRRRFPHGAADEKEFLMAVLVGIYLIQGDAFDVVRDGKTSWTGTWTLFRSPGVNRTQWESLTGGETSTSFTTPVLAALAGEDDGVSFARMLQGDDGLEPMTWEDVPAVVANFLRRACVGASRY
ncbi:hypothetical protein [Dyella sp.]|uniref:hypothetical protein n=1 Tax=Dyella sp. TaxID=1869338 RepID=UPI00283CB338|nr:hypothetical protein [Dyella sp.]MDR3446000.1 hypothetical protein [Dyella sp.]